MKTMLLWSGRLACILASGCLFGADALVVEPGARELVWRGVSHRAGGVELPPVHWLRVDAALPLQEGDSKHLHPLGAPLCFVLARPDGKSEIVVCDPAEVAAVAPQIAERVQSRRVATWLLWNQPREGAR